MTRDSKVWPILMVVGAVLAGVAALSNPAEFGIPAAIFPYIKLAAFVVGIVVSTGSGIAYQHANLPSGAEKQAGKIPGSYVLPLALLAVVLCPSLASAQGPITASAYRISREYQAVQNAPLIVNGEPTETGLIVAASVFVVAQASDYITTYVALGQKDVNGNPVNQEANPMLPNSRAGIAAIKAGATAGGLIAAWKLWPDKSCTSGCSVRKWEAVLSLLGASMVSFGAACNNAYQIVKVGEYPAPVPTMQKVRVPIGLRFTLHP